VEFGLNHSSSKANCQRATEPTNKPRSVVVPVVKNNLLHYRTYMKKNHAGTTLDRQPGHLTSCRVAPKRGYCVRLSASAC